MNEVQIRFLKRYSVFIPQIMGSIPAIMPGHHDPRKPYLIEEKVLQRATRHGWEDIEIVVDEESHNKALALIEELKSKKSE